MLLKTQDTAFRFDELVTLLSKARANLSPAIREAKHNYAQRINGHFRNTKKTRHMWEGIRTITDYPDSKTTLALIWPKPFPRSLTNLANRFSPAYSCRSGI